MAGKETKKEEQTQRGIDPSGGLTMNKLNRVKVWDLAVRVFHWGLVVAFALAYFTGEERLEVHVAAGYTVLGLVLFRILWGFVGSRYTRFSSFVFRPQVIMAYLKNLAWLQARRYMGHNPAGGAMIVLLLIALLGTVGSGLAVYAADEHAGPLAFWLAGISEVWEDRLEEGHEFFADLTVVLVLIHLLGVLIESVLHKENLVGAMFTGYKRRDQ
jgi:cytochrome b